MSKIKPIFFRIPSFPTPILPTNPQLILIHNSQISLPSFASKFPNNYRNYSLFPSTFFFWFPLHAPLFFVPIVSGGGALDETWAGRRTYVIISARWPPRVLECCPPLALRVRDRRASHEVFTRAGFRLCSPWRFLFDFKGCLGVWDKFEKGLRVL
jgi:hypothetical protein